MLKIGGTKVRRATEKQIDRFLRYPSRMVVGVLDTSDGLDPVSEDQAEQERVAAILSEHGGHFVDYYGPLAIVHLVP